MLSFAGSIENAPATLSEEIDDALYG